MDAPARSGISASDSRPTNPPQRILAVAPLNSMPYIGPPSPHTSPSNLTQDEQNDNVAAADIGLVLTGSAAGGQAGPVIGRMDIAESEDSYIFCVSLPGVAVDGFSCDIDPDGKVSIKGVTTTGEKTVCRYSQVFRMRTQNLCPPGHFSISFQLPGPVDNLQFNGHLTDGVLEVTVKKK